MPTQVEPTIPLHDKEVLRYWWPLALSWLVMTAELPLISAVLAHMTNAEINLAAWGIVFSISIIIQAPSTMLLAASTALSKDWSSYRRLRRFMIVIGASLTAVHALIAFTPLYYLVVGEWMAAPAEVLEPARVGLMIMTPWSWGTAYRRFEQGVLIRFGHPRSVTLGALLRLLIDGAVLTAGFRVGGAMGVQVAALAVAFGVIGEALYAGWRARPVVRHQLMSEPEGEPLTAGSFVQFYTPLAITILISLTLQPLVSAALGRLPGPLVSLAVWPIVFGLLAMLQSVGTAHNEVVIALLDKPNAVRTLRRVTGQLCIIVTMLMLFLLLTPLATFWLQEAAALSNDMLILARNGLWIGLLLPALRLVQSWYQGILVYAQQTRPVTESVILALAASVLLLGVGILTRPVEGLYLGLAAMSLGMFCQTLWLWWRSRELIQQLEAEPQSDLLEGVPVLAAVRASTKEPARRRRT